MKSLSFPFRAHFRRFLPIYLIACALVPSLVTYGVILRTNPKQEEVFSLFVEASVKDQKGIEGYVKEHTSSANKEVNVYSSLSRLPTFPALFQTQGLSSDLLILSEKAFKDHYASSFIELLPSSPYYGESNKTVEKKHFGIKIASNGEGPLKEFLSYEKETAYYAFLNKESVHAGRFAEGKKTEQIWNLLEALRHEE